MVVEIEFSFSITEQMIDQFINPSTNNLNRAKKFIAEKAEVLKL